MPKKQAVYAINTIALPYMKLTSTLRETYITYVKLT